VDGELDGFDPNTRIRPLCSHDPADDPAREIDDDTDAVFGSESAMATAIAATCCSEIFPDEAGVAGAAVAATASGCTADDSRSSMLMPLIDSASNASTANTMPMPTPVNSSPSFSKS